jgi:hypothetical protein
MALGSSSLAGAGISGKVEHYLFCSSIWVHGHPAAIPSTEVDRPDTYGVKAKIEALLLRQAGRNGLPRAGLPGECQTSRP